MLSRDEDACKCNRPQTTKRRKNKYLKEKGIEGKLD